MSVTPSGEYHLVSGEPWGEHRDHLVSIYIGPLPPHELTLLDSIYTVILLMFIDVYVLFGYVGYKLITLYSSFFSSFYIALITLLLDSNWTVIPQSLTLQSCSLLTPIFYVIAICICCLCVVYGKGQPPSLQYIIPSHYGIHTSTYSIHQLCYLLVFLLILLLPLPYCGALFSDS